jgi:hypothetical protein
MRGKLGFPVLTQQQFTSGAAEFPLAFTIMKLSDLNPHWLENYNMSTAKAL